MEMEIKMKVFTPNLCVLRFEELTGALNKSFNNKYKLYVIGYKL